MKEVRLVAFDLDDTLAPSKSRVDPEMARLLTELIRLVPVCIISGGNIDGEKLGAILAGQSPF